MKKYYVNISISIQKLIFRDGQPVHVDIYIKHDTLL